MAPRPRISVCVPTRGRPVALARCLDALGRSTLAAGELEVVVVCDGEDVAPPADEAAGETALVWRVQRRSGPAAARNLAARMARAPTLAFLDDDCVPSADWAERLLERVDAEPHAVVAGRVRNGLPRNVLATTSQLVLEVVVDMYNARAGKPGFAPSSNIALRADLFQRLGGFDERFRTAAAEDRDFCDRVFHAGHPLVIDALATVDHFHDLDVRGFVRQSAAYGRGEVTYRAVCAARGQPANVVRGGFFRRLLRASFAQGPLRGTRLATLAAASQVVFLANYWGTALGRSPAS